TVMQWQNAYIITEYAGELIIIDQNRAHQSVLFQSFIKKSQSNILSQQLLFPIDLVLSTNEVLKIKEAEQYWISFGFDLIIDDEKLNIKAIPGDLQSEMIVPLFSDFLSSDIDISEVDYSSLLAKFMAKAAAIKKGTPLSHKKLQSLVQQLFALPQFNYSPFGKVIYKSFTL